MPQAAAAEAGSGVTEVVPGAEGAVEEAGPASRGATAVAVAADAPAGAGAGTAEAAGASQPAEPYPCIRKQASRGGSGRRGRVAAGLTNIPETTRTTEDPPSWLRPPC